MRQCAADMPDLILMDLIMPRMDGAEASRIIMRDSPCAILVVTATVEGHSSKVFEAMGWGALDAINTPALEKPGEPGGGSELLTKIAMLSKLIGKSPTQALSPWITAAENGRPQPDFPLIAIGASTGGPAALASLLAALPTSLHAAITIVQHVDEVFAPGLASWLAQAILARRSDHPRERPARPVAGSDRIHQRPSVADAGADVRLLESARGLLLSSFRQRLFPFRGSLLAGHRHRRTPDRHGCRWRRGSAGDAACGWHTIAQDQATCIVYGMPKAAAKIGAAVEILPLERSPEPSPGGSRPPARQSEPQKEPV